MKEPHLSFKEVKGDIPGSLNEGVAPFRPFSNIPPTTYNFPIMFAPYSFTNFFAETASNENISNFEVLGISF